MLIHRMSNINLTNSPLARQHRVTHFITEASFRNSAFSRSEAFSLATLIAHGCSARDRKSLMRPLYTKPNEPFPSSSRMVTLERSTSHESFLYTETIRGEKFKMKSRPEDQVPKSGPNEGPRNQNLARRTKKLKFGPKDQKIEIWPEGPKIEIWPEGPKN
jgi:hypothetical protein